MTRLNIHGRGMRRLNGQNLSWGVRFALLVLILIKRRVSRDFLQAFFFFLGLKPEKKSRTVFYLVSISFIYSNLNIIIQ